MLLKYQCLFVLAATVVLLVVAIVTLSPSLLSLPIDDRMPNLAETLRWFASYNRTLIESSLQKKGYSVTDLPPWSALWTDKIHLCVMFNLKGIKPRKDVTDILISYYFLFFENITLIFDGANWERPDYVPEFVNVISCDSHEGWYQHKCIRSCMQQGTEETKGYLYIADDMFINLTMMSDLPRTKIWFSHMTQKNYSWILNPGPKGWDWDWWGPPANGSKNLELVINSLPVEWKDQLRKNAGFPEHFKSKAISDIIYIPHTLQDKMSVTLSFIINTTDLLGEIATCLAVNLVTSDYVTFRYGYLWGPDRNSIDYIKKRARTAHFVHPFKLGLNENVELWIKYMEKQLSTILQRRHK